MVHNMLVLINSSHGNWKVTTTCDLLIQMFSQHVTVSWGFGLCWEAQSNETVSVFIYRHIRMLPQERGAKRCHQRSQLCLNQQHVSISPAGMGVMLRPRGFCSDTLFLIFCLDRETPPCCPPGPARWQVIVSKAYLKGQNDHVATVKLARHQKIVSICLRRFWTTWHFTAFDHPEYTLWAWKLLNKGFPSIDTGRVAFKD